MTPAPTDISVLIRTYTERRWDNLVAAIRSAQVQTAPPRDVVVIVDHNPALLERVRAEFPDVMAVPNREPRGERGVSGAINSGIAAAQGSVIAILDDDAVAKPDWLARLADGYRDPEVVAVGGAIAPVWQSGPPSWFPREFYWVVGCTYLGLPETTSAVRNLIATNMSFRREVFEDIGGFRVPRCEETEFCIRIAQRWPDKVLLYEPRAMVDHQVPADRASWAYFRSRCYVEGRTKALVSRLVGRRDGLASEWRYTLGTLPFGVGRGLADVVLRRDPTGLTRAGAIVAGLAITTAGYAAGTLAEQLAPRQRTFQPSSPLG